MLVEIKPTSSIFPDEITHANREDDIPLECVIVNQLTLLAAEITGVDVDYFLTCALNQETGAIKIILNPSNDRRADHGPTADFLPIKGSDHGLLVFYPSYNSPGLPGAMTTCLYGGGDIGTNLQTGSMLFGSTFDHTTSLVPTTVDNNPCLDSFQYPTKIEVDGRLVTIDPTGNLTGRVGVVKFSPNLDNVHDPLIHLTPQTIIPLSQVIEFLNHQNDFATNSHWLPSTLTGDLVFGRHTLIIPPELINSKMPLADPSALWSVRVQAGLKETPPPTSLTPAQIIAQQDFPPDTQFVPERLTPADGHSHQFVDTLTLPPGTNLKVITAQPTTPKAIALFQAATSQKGYHPEQVAQAAGQLFKEAQNQRTLNSLPNFIRDAFDIQPPTTSIFDGLDLMQTLYFSYQPIFESIGLDKDTLVIGIDSISGNMIVFEIASTQIDLLTHQATIDGVPDRGIDKEIENQWRISQLNQRSPILSGSPGSVIANSCHRIPETLSIHALSEHCRLASNDQPVQVTVYDNNDYPYVVFLPAGTHGRAVSRIDPMGENGQTIVIVRLDYYAIDLMRMDPASASIMQKVFGTGIMPSQFHVEVPIDQVYTTTRPTTNSLNLSNHKALADISKHHNISARSASNHRRNFL